MSKAVGCKRFVDGQRYLIEDDVIDRFAKNKNEGWILCYKNNILCYTLYNFVKLYKINLI